MAKNYMADVAKLLGVELGEEFKIKGSNKTYKITNTGMYYKDIDSSGCFGISAEFLLTLMRGENEVIKLPWKPKNCESYWYIGWRKGRDKWKMVAYKSLHSDESPYSNFFVATGNCFRTKEEAIAARYDVFKRLTGKDWAETYGKEGGNNATD